VFVQKSPVRRSGRANRPANLAELSVSDSEIDVVEDSKASPRGSDADEEASDGKESEDKASDDTSDVDITGDDEPPARCEVLSS